MRRLAAILLALAAVFAAAPARAASASDHDLALALFKHAGEAYNRGDFRGAADDLTKAYALEPAPVLLYNLGRAYEGLGDTKKAIDAYGRYLEAQPNAEDRGALETRLATLRRQLELEQRAARPVAPPPLPPRAAPKRRPLAPLPVVLAAVGAAGLGAGGVLGALALSENANENAATTSQLDAQSAHDRGATFATAANVAFVAGAVLAVAGIVWIIVDRATATPRSTRAAVPFMLRF
jgi:tetratricopeptide (TPR) repeat protein